MFSQTKSCPGNRNDWEKQGRHLNCSITNGVYHCLLDEKGNLGEICRKGQPVQVQANYCPQYNYFAGSVTTVLCNKSVGCPYEAFKSNEVYKYPVCLEVSQRDPFVYDGSTTSLPWPIIGGVVGVLLVILTVVAIVCYRKRRSQKTPDGEDEEIPLLARETPFYTTSTFHEADSFLKDGGKILCLIGKWGSGKSTTAKQVFKSLTGRTPIVIEDILKYDMNTCKDSVIVEEPLPREGMLEVEKIKRVEKIIALCKQMQETDKQFVVITLTEEAWKIIAEEITNCEFDVKEYRCIDLNWNSLSKGDRIHILHTIFQFYNPDKPFSKVEDIVSIFNPINVGFPEICTLFSKCCEFQKSKIFFNRPLRYLSSYLEKMCKTLNVKDKFLLLAHMSLNNMKIDVNKSNDKLWKIFTSCGLNTDNVDLTSIIPMEFVLEEEPSVYVLQHEIIKRMTLITFGKHYFSELLQYSSKKDLEGWIKQKDRHILIRFAEVSQQASEIEPILEIDHEQWVEFQRKMGISHQPECEKND